jgi:hypothetical protein
MGSCPQRGNTLAKTVFTPEEVVLQDGQKIILRPLVISRLKEAMAYVDAPDEDGETDTDGLDFLVKLTGICVRGQVPEDYNLEDALDAVTAKRIIFVGTGIDFDDQNLMIAAAAAQVQNGETLTS